MNEKEFFFKNKINAKMLYRKGFQRMMIVKCSGDKLFG